MYSPPPPPGLLHFCSSHRDLCNTKADYGTRQCCGSGSGIRCLFDLGIRNRFFPDPGSQVLIFLELSDNFLSKKFCDSLKIFPNFFPPHFKTKVNCNFVKFVAPPSTQRLCQSFRKMPDTVLASCSITPLLVIYFSYSGMPATMDQFLLQR
jgi:hypothetical protein